MFIVIIMSLSRKFIIVVLWSIFFIAITNIIWFYIFYSTFLKIFLAEKIQGRSQVSLEYINSLVLKQWLDDVDGIFNDVSIALFEKFWEDNTINLDTRENVDLVINYLLQSWVAPKFIEELVPTNNFEKVLDALKNKESPEYKFIRNIFISIVITNIVAIILLWILIGFFVQKTILPIREATRQIKALKPWKGSVNIEYSAQDEVWLLISSINDLNQRLILQEEIRSKLLADISHELKTPITSIQCYLEWIIDWVITLDDKNLTSISTEMERLISLVNRIMKYEQFENTALELDYTQQEFYPLLVELVSTHKQRVKENSQSIVISWDKSAVWMFDEDLFRQLVHNLIWNFLKYAWKNAQLTISVSKNSINFWDNGVWISKKEIPFLTEKFYQGDTSKSAHIDERGIWVWLSIVWKIISAHGWDFKISSDEGKWFNFKLMF